MRRYGVSDTTASLVVVRIGGPELLADDVERDMDAAIKGIKAPFARLEDLTDWAAVKKVCVCINNPSPSNAKRASIQYHKLGNEVGIREAKDNPERERAVVDGIVVSSVAMKSVMG